MTTAGPQAHPHHTFPGRFARATAEEGFGLIEMLMATTLFLCVSAPLVGVLLASVAQQKLSHERTLAAQTAQTAIESIRALPYSSIGTQNGNPAGTIPPTQQAGQFGISGLDATVTTRVSFMDDAPATSYRNRADYKRVVVTVVRNSDSRRLTQDVTYVAPPGGGAFAGQNEGIVLAQVIDAASNTPVVGASVTLSGGPTSARTDTTDASGSVVFPALLPTTVSLNHYDVTATMNGYATMREDAPPGSTARTAIVGGQTFQTIIRVYKPSSISVVPRNADGTPYTGLGTVTISSSRGTQSFAFTGPQFTLSAQQTLAGEPVVPNVQYTVHVLAANGATATAVTAPVPTAYPTDLTKTFIVTLGAPATMERLKLQGPVVGFLMQRALLLSGSTVSLQGWAKPVAEPEIAVRMMRDLAGGATADAAAAAVKEIFPAIELADLDPAPTPDNIDAVLEGDIYQRHVILCGNTRSGAATAGLTSRVTRRGKEAARSTDPEALTGKLPDIVAHVANTLAAYGEKLSAGDVIITGSITPPPMIEPDETAFGHALDPIGEVSVQFSRDRE